MTTSSTTASWQRPLIVFGCFVLVVAALYWARSVLIPVVLASLLTFTLSPLVAVLQRHGLRRVPAVLLVLALVIASLVGLGAVLLVQLKALAEDLPNHQEEIARKVVVLREATQSSWLDRFTQTYQAVTEQARQPGTAQPVTPPPVPVTIEPADYWFLRADASGAVEGLAGTGMVVILLVFMLIHRESLRNRVIRLWHFGSLPRMTRALDDAGQRISRLLFAQLMINVTFGLCVALGLFLIGVPYATLWGFLAALMRYVPYVGAWLAAAFPIVLSVAIFPSWVPPLLVIGLFLVLELLAGQVAEPLLFGHSIGVSQVALLVSAAFWTWLWGPLGLVLSAPLTACLVVAGRYVPPLEFLSVLLGDEPALEPHVAYFQRLLARDEIEAAEVIEDYIEQHELDDVFDKVFLPALVMVKETRQRDELSRQDEQFIAQTTREILDEVVRPRVEQQSNAAEEAPATEPLPEPILVFGCPARDELDELMLRMVQLMLDPRRCHFEVLSAQLLTAEVVGRVEAEKPDLIGIASLPADGLAHTRYLCKRLRSQFPETDVVVVRWAFEDHDGMRAREKLASTGVGKVASSLREFRDLLRPQVQQLRHEHAASSRVG